MVLLIQGPLTHFKQLHTGLQELLNGYSRKTKRNLGFMQVNQI